MKKLLLLTALLWAFPGYAQPILKVYAPASMTSPYGSGPTLKEEFEKSCQCQLEWIPFDTSMILLNRLKWEGKRARADLVMGLDSLVAKESTASGLFQDQGLIPYSKTCLAFIYDQRRLINPPQSLEDLAERNYRILTQDPRTSGTGTGLVVWIRQVYGNNAPAFWKKLKPRILTYTKGWGESYTLFRRGEADLVLSYMTSPLYHEIMDGKTDYQACRFQEGHVCIHQMMGIPRTSKNPDLAQKFIIFLLSSQGQDILATKGWQYPLAGKPEAWEGAETYIDPGTQVSPPEKIDRVAWVQEWEKALR